MLSGLHVARRRQSVANVLLQCSYFCWLCQVIKADGELCTVTLEAGSCDGDASEVTCRRHMATYCASFTCAMFLIFRSFNFPTFRANMVYLAPDLHAFTVVCCASEAVLFPLPIASTSAGSPSVIPPHPTLRCRLHNQPSGGPAHIELQGPVRDRAPPLGGCVLRSGFRWPSQVLPQTQCLTTSSHPEEVVMENCRLFIVLSHTTMY